LVIVPLTLFSGTFFPLSLLPAWCRPIAWLTPLWHGSELCRELTSGTVTVATPLHALVLAAMAAAGFVAARRTYASRLLA
jgi:lipooligosaccharide transport system permease protein